MCVQYPERHKDTHEAIGVIKMNKKFQSKSTQK